MQYTNEAIRRAGLGGYEPFKTVKIEELICVLEGDTYFCKFKDVSVKGLCSITVHKMLLDPEFFRCLGVYEGWGKCTMYSFSTGKVYSEHEYIYKMHALLDHLIAGGTAEEYFKLILKK